MQPKAVIMVGPSSNPRRYTNLSSLGRVLSGTGSDSFRHEIARVCNEGGGFVKPNVYVTYSEHQKL